MAKGQVERLEPLEQLEPLERYISHHGMSNNNFWLDLICHGRVVRCETIEQFDQSEKDEVP